MPSWSIMAGVAVCVALTCGAASIPASAGSCDIGECSAPPPPRTAPVEPATPRAAKRRPVAIGAPIRAVKTRDGRYVRVKPKLQPRQTAKTPKPPRFLPVVVAPQASEPSPVPANVPPVEVVEPDRLNAIDLAVDDPPIVPIRVTTTSEPPPAGLETAIGAHDAKPQIEAAAHDAPAAAKAPPAAETDAWSRFRSWIGALVTSALEALRGPSS